VNTPLARDKRFGGWNLLVVKRVEKLLKCIPDDNKMQKKEKLAHILHEDNFIDTTTVK